MNKERDIFEKAVEIDDTEKRNTFLDEACGEDSGLRLQIERLLNECLKTDDFILDQSISDEEHNAWEFQIGDHIGPYRLMEQIGEGGMGIVFVAEQQEPVRRMVALKITRPGMDTREVINRFEAERQALAMMDHPNIARVLDAGATDSGRPYFVMELVRGVPITRFCDDKKLSSQQRLLLFIDTCRAIQHAHQKGIIHRDIKPGNVLVTMHDDQPVVKVIDFGVAKAIHQPLAAGTVYTKFAQLIGTPLYMSPEQAEMSGLNIDTRSDIYSLGVLLYELLTGETPFDKRRIKQAAFDEMRRIIREEDPPAPSTKVSSLGDESDTVTENRGTDQRQLVQQLRGDLDWIVMKAMEKDRRRRYATAIGFAQDVQRFLEHEPVLASPPSSLYQFRKFARRNRALLGSATTLAIILITATVVSVYMAIAADRARQNAVDFANQARISNGQYEAINDFLINDFLAAARPSGSGPGKDTTVKYAMDQAVEKIDEAFGDRPEIEMAIRMPMGVTYRELGLYDEADRQLIRALSLHEQLYGELDERTLQCRHEVARLRQLQGNYVEAKHRFRELARACLTVYGKSHELTIYANRNTATNMLQLGEFEAAESILKEFADICRQTQEPGSYVLFDTLNELAYLLHDLGRLPEAETIYQENYDNFLSAHGERNTNTLVGLNNLASVLEDQGRLIRAKPMFEKSLRLRREIFGDKNQRTTVAKSNLARILSTIGEYTAAEELYKQAVADGSEVEGADHRYTHRSIGSRAINLARMGQLEEAEQLLQKSSANLARLMGDNHFDTLEYRKRHADVLALQGRNEEAVAILEDVLSKHTAEKSPWQKIAATQSSLGASMVGQGELEEANRILNSCVNTYRENPSLERAEFGLALGRLGLCMSKLDQNEQAEELLLESHSVTESLELVPTKIRLAAIDRLISFYEQTEDSENAAIWKSQREDVVNEK